MADSSKHKIHFGTKTDSIPQRNVNLSLGCCMFSYVAQRMIGKPWHYLAPYMIKGLRHLQGEGVIPPLWQDKDWQLVLWQIHGLFSIYLPCPIISAPRFLSFRYLILCPTLPACCACIQSVMAENNRSALNWLTRCDGEAQRTDLRWQKPPGSNKERDSKSLTFCLRMFGGIY